MGMKRAVMAVLIIAALGAMGFGVRFGLRHQMELRTKREREARYQAALVSYTNALKPGMKRQEVEDLLRARKVEFRQLCCVEQHQRNKHSWDDLAPIGQE